MNEYDELIQYMRSNRLDHCARMIERSGCRVIVFIDRRVPSDFNVAYDDWCRDNCFEKYYVYNENYVFFDCEEDAMAFKLQWM